MAFHQLRLPCFSSSKNNFWSSLKSVIRILAVGDSEAMLLRGFYGSIKNLKAFAGRRQLWHGKGIPAEEAVCCFLMIFPS